MSTVIEGKHVTVIVDSPSGREIHRFPERMNFRHALIAYAEIVGVDDPEKYINKTGFGYRMTFPGGDVRATYRRA